MYTCGQVDVYVQRDTLTWDTVQAHKDEKCWHMELTLYLALSSAARGHHRCPVHIKRYGKM